MKQRDLELLLQQFVDGELDEDGCEEVVALLRSDSEVLETYCDYADLDCTLFNIHCGPTHLGTEQAPITMTIQKRRMKRAQRVAMVSAAAAIAVLVAILYVVLAKEPLPTVSFAMSPGTVFSVQHASEGTDDPEPGTLEVGSRLMLQRGHVEFVFASGVRSIIQAPADLTLHAAGDLFLAKGTAWFHVPPKAVGFRVRSEELEVIDLGTEFGVRSSPLFPDEIHVLTGKVKVTNLNPLRHEVTLSKGEARQADPVGRLKSLPLAADVFLATLPSSPALTPNATTLLSNDGSFLFRDNYSGTVGIAFTPAVDLEVTRLGFEDLLFRGLDTAHEVGIWTDTGTSIVSTTVAAGTIAPYHDGWRYAAITPVVLRAGKTYVLAAEVTEGGDGWTWGGGDISAPGALISPDATIVEARHEKDSPGLVYPTLVTGPGTVRWGPANMQYVVIGPENPPEDSP